MIVIYIEVEIISITISYSGGKEAMMEYYLKQATEASEEKDVILYFDEAELGLISEISTGTDCFYLYDLEFPCTKSSIHRFHYKKIIVSSSLDIPAKITLVGATDSSANLDNALLSKVRYAMNKKHHQ